MARILRPAHLGDVGLIVSSWASGMRRGCMSRFVPDDVYWPGQHELIKRILSSAASAVCCDEADPHKLHGCIVWQPGPTAIVHWLFVKPADRHQGIARMLLDLAVGDPPRIYCTQAPKDFDRFDQGKFVHAPYLLWGIMPQSETDATKGHDDVRPESKPAA